MLHRSAPDEQRNYNRFESRATAVAEADYIFWRTVGALLELA